MNKYYIGACINIERRLYEHNIGHSEFTSLGIPWKLMYTEEFEDAVSAKKRELQVKKMKPGKYIGNQKNLLRLLAIIFLPGLEMNNLFSLRSIL